MKLLFTLTAAVATMALLPSCSTRIADLTLATTKNLDLNNTSTYTVNESVKVKGEDNKHIIVFVSTGTPSPKEAIDRAIEQGGEGCVALSNVVLYSHSWYIPYVYGKTSFTAEGNPIYKR